LPGWTGFLLALALLLGCSREWHPAGVTELEIVGSPEFSNQVHRAVALLRERDLPAYVLLTNYVGRIKEADRSGMCAYDTPPTFELSAISALPSVTWCAAAIAHDSFHSKLYHDYRGPREREVPAPVWTGQAAERKCMAHQLSVMHRIGAPAPEIDWARSYADGRYVRDGETREDYLRRNW
jgi:hypothetical protein